MLSKNQQAETFWTTEHTRYLIKNVSESSGSKNTDKRITDSNEYVSCVKHMQMTKKTEDRITYIYGNCLINR